MSERGVKTQCLHLCVILLLCHFLEWYTGVHGEVNYRKLSGLAVKTLIGVRTPAREDACTEQLQRFGEWAPSQQLWSDCVPCFEA